MVNPVCHWFLCEKSMHTQALLSLATRACCPRALNPKRSQPTEIRMQEHIPVNYPSASRHATGKNSRRALDSEHKHAPAQNDYIYIFALFVRLVCECTAARNSIWARGVRHVFRRADFNLWARERYLLLGGYQFRRVCAGSRANSRFLVDSRGVVCSTSYISE